MKSETSQPISPPARKRMTVFRAGEGVALDHETMPFEGVDPATLAGLGRIMASGPRAADASHTTILFQSGGEEGVSLSHAWFKTGFISPRHSHNADCIYYILAGEARFGAARLGPGDGMYVPAEQAYVLEVGDEGCELLEFRNAAQFNIHFKDNDEAQWAKVSQSYARHMPQWENELPPSQR
jgi:mannose-6-phosphate isomerase-like protein (cupin superfamily)